MNTHKSHHSPQDSYPKHMCYYLNPVGVRDEYPGDRRNKRMLFRRHKTWRNHESVEYNVKPLRMQPFLARSCRPLRMHPEKLRMQPGKKANASLNNNCECNFLREKGMMNHKIKHLMSISVFR